MADLLQDLFTILAELIFTIPMPWRSGIFFLVFAYLGYRILRFLFMLLLLPEFWITSLLRRIGLKPLPGTLLFDRLIGWLFRFSRWMPWIALLIAIASVIAWYQRPYIENSTLSRYIEMGFDWWYDFETSLTSSK